MAAVANPGHGVVVLLKIYAHCISGQATAANQRIAEALGTPDAGEDPGDEARSLRGKRAEGRQMRPCTETRGTSGPDRSC